MTDKVVATKPGNGQTLANYGSRQDVIEFVGRLRTMLPGGDKLTDGQIKALAQASLATGLDPLNGEIWMIPGRGLMTGVKGLRRKAHDQVQGNFWLEFLTITDKTMRDLFQIPDGALAFEARLFDSETLRTYAETCERLLKAGLPWDAVKEMVGSKPYTPGIGVFKKGEQSRMEPAQCGMKRAEADALKRRFDVGFGLGVETDNEPASAAEWVEVVAGQAHAAVEQDMAQAKPSTPTPPSNTELDAAVLAADAKQAANLKAALTPAQQRAETKKYLEQSDKF